MKRFLIVVAAVLCSVPSIEMMALPVTANRQKKVGGHLIKKRHDPPNLQVITMGNGFPLP